MMNTRADLAGNTSKAGVKTSVPQKSNSSRHAHSPLHSILFLHRTVGNQAVEKLIRSGVIQAKLTIGQQEPHRIQRMCTECEQELHGQPMEEKVVQAKDTLENKPEVTPSTESQTHGMRNGGQP